MTISFLLKLFSCIFFAVGNFLKKKSTLAGVQLCCLQSFFSALLLLPFVPSFSWDRTQPWIWAGRFFLGTLASLLWVYSLQSLSLFNVMSLQWGQFFY